MKGRSERPQEELAGKRKREGPFYDNLISDHQVFIDPVSDDRAPEGEVRAEGEGTTPEQGTREQETREERSS
ncbi:MAG: hypothetical protein CME08_08545, partial [Gemmatimonadetes bacterium]|nr:hypothetical protein [Gemmatimonadota bacterium]